MKVSWWSGQTRFGVSPGLSRIAELLERLGNPHREYPIVHVAGTNGKGSVSAMVAAALKAQGLRVGLYVSPDMGQVNERVLIDGEPVTEDFWDVMASEIEVRGQGLFSMPTWFETVTALAFLAFKERRVDIAVVEVGLGGRLDATNVVSAPLVSIITPIAFDHMHYLGNTIEAIAAEKAGILKVGSELVLAHQPFAAARQVIREKAAGLAVPIYESSVRATVAVTGPELVTGDGLVVRVPLRGAYQANNLETAWTAVERLTKHGLIRDRHRALVGLAGVEWPGRFQVVSEKPLVVVDGAHNPHGIAGVLDTLSIKPWSEHQWRVVFGVLEDKDAYDMLRLLAQKASHITLTRVPGERGRDPQPLRDRLGSDVSMTVVENPVKAVAEQRAMLSGAQALLVTGSLSLLAELKIRGVIPQRRRMMSIGDGGM